MKLNKILVIDPGKGWGHFVSKMYCYKKLAYSLKSKIIFLTKSSTQAKAYLKDTNFCEDVIYFEETKRGFFGIINKIKSTYDLIKLIKSTSCEHCFIFHPSLRYLLAAKLSNIKKIWCLGLRFQSLFIKKKFRLYDNFFSKTIPNDFEAYEFVKKICKINNFKFQPLYRPSKKTRDLVGIIIAASGFQKRWKIKNYIEIINFLHLKGYENFLIVSGIDQLNDEKIITNYFKKKNIKIITSAEKKINEVIPFLKRCKFSIGNDTGFSHLSINFNIETLVIYGDCSPQYYSSKIVHIDIESNINRSSSSIHTITTNKVLEKLANFLKGEM